MIQSELPRKLKAILAADIEGYSRFLGDDEGEALDLLSRRRSLLDDEIKRFGGHLFGEAGDGFMVEFDSAEDAVRCAVGVQKSIARMNAQQNGKPMWLRIGVSMGDVIDDGRTKHGNAINVAARIQNICDPGGVCLTSGVHEQVANRLAYAFDEMGPALFKNILKPVDVVRVRWAEQPPSALARQPTVSREAEAIKPSLAVLPFTFLGPHRGKTYLAESLVEEIITELSHYRWLSVVSKSSSFAYKARRVDARSIARELGVRYLIEGNLRQDSTKLRINLHLISGETGEDLWSDRFDRPVEELFEIKEDMVLGIVSAIEPKVRSAEIQRSRKKPPTSLTAYDYYLQALPFRGAISATDNETALELLEKAIRLDHHFAPALAVASMCYTTRRDQGWGTLSQKEIERTLNLARSAVAADFDDAVALCFSAHTLASIGNDLETARLLIDRSLHISPSYAEAWARSAMIHIYAGDLVTAERHAENAIKLGPLDDRLFMPLCALGLCYLFSERELQAIEVTHRALLGRAKPPMAYVIQLAAAHRLGNRTIMGKAAAALYEAAPAFDFHAWLTQGCFQLTDQLTILWAAFRELTLGKTGGA